MLCVDKRTGKEAYKHDFPANANQQLTQSLLVSGNSEKKGVDLTMQQTAVTLKFTDDPQPPSQTVGKSAPTPAGGKTARPIWNWLQKTFGRIMDESSRGEDDH